MTWFYVLLTQMSPTIVEALKKGLKTLLDELAKMAEETPNKYDDMAVTMIRKVLKVDE